MKCKKCGAEIATDDIFCNKCGDKIANENGSATYIDDLNVGIENNINKQQKHFFDEKRKEFKQKYINDEKFKRNIIITIALLCAIIILFVVYNILGLSSQQRVVYKHLNRYIVNEYNKGNIILNDEATVAIDPKSKDQYIYVVYEEANSLKFLVIKNNELWYTTDNGEFSSINSSAAKSALRALIDSKSMENEDSNSNKISLKNVANKLNVKSKYLYNMNDLFEF